MSERIRRIVFVAVALLLAAGLVSEPTGARASTPQQGTAQVYLGVWQPGVPTNMSALDTFEQDAGRHVAIVVLWRDWVGAESTLDVSWLQDIAARGSIPMITWMPEDWDTGASYGLKAIASGQYDAYITGWAQELASYGKPVFLRWADEMNGNWYPWGRKPVAYVAAWRHIHNLFAQAGATNVQWVWCPSVFWHGSNAVNPKIYYPGKRYVNWIGLGGYNFSRRGWMSFGQIYGHAYDVLTQMSNQPLMIAEMGSGEATAAEARHGKSKARWIHTAFVDDIPHMPRIKAVIWFNEDTYGPDTHGEDWRIESSPAAQAAFAAAVRAPAYVAYWR